jgi:site-specific DNA-methyltransferase (adenine-specific)
MKIINGDCLAEMKKMQDNSIDFIVTDPPYGISFKGREWDKQIPSLDYWREMLRICKPGAMMAVAGLPRMIHRLTCAVEDAGWEIRDMIMYLFGSGFPKSLDVSKAIDKAKGLERETIGRKYDERYASSRKRSFNPENPTSTLGSGDGGILTAPSSALAKTFSGYGTALKPAWEGWVIAMKPLDGTFAHNAEKWGVAGINIDESRIGTSDSVVRDHGNPIRRGFNGGWKPYTSEIHHGRWPANLILDEESAEMLDQMTGNNVSRFFYCAKPSTTERNRGCDGMALKDASKLGSFKENFGGRIAPKNGYPQQNHHPTVKAIALMKYIIKLLAPPGNPILLDPFAGSGSTLIAAKELDIDAIGIDLSAEYCEIANARIAAAKLPEPDLFDRELPDDI